MVEDRVQEPLRLDDVGLDKDGGPVYGAVHVRLGGKVDDRRRPVLGEQPRHEVPVADRAPHEDVVGVVGHGGERARVAGVREGVQVHHLEAPHRAKHEVAADKPGAAGDQ